MRPRPPGSIPTIGTLNIVFGAIFSFCCLSAVFVHATGFWLLGDPFLQEIMESFMEQEVPGYLIIKWGTLGLGTVCFLLMMISGMGLVSHANWGRVLAIVVAWVLIPFLIGSATYDLVFHVPALNRFLRLNPQLRPGAGMIWMQVVVQMVVYILFLAFAVITLCTMMSSRVHAFFHESAFQEHYYDDDWDDEDYDRPSRREGW